MRISFLCIAFLFGACDGSGPGEQQSIVLPTSAEVTLTNGTVSVVLDSLSMVSRSKWNYDPNALDLFSEPINSAGLWLAAEQEGTRSNIASPFPWANGFELMSTEKESGGIYEITRENLEFEILNWPISLGAPVEINGNPKMYGDRMAWAAFEPSSTPGDESTSLKGLRVGLSIFVFDQAPLSNSVFLRYDIKNISSETISNLHVGYGGDTDLVQYRESSGKICETAWWENQTGYDLSRHITFTYTSRHPEDSVQSDDCYGAVAGYSILNMSSPRGLGQNKLAHRIWRRNQFASYPEFSGELLENGEVILFALQGLSPSGAPMVDPSGTQTKFAFTGDPIAMTGWIDERHDVRSLQSIQPVDLAPGDERSITVAWLMAKGPNLETGLELFKEQFDLIMSRRDAWDF
ncbi:MAG: hypothetical protein BMS9Abin05_2642 [Rhodothermia bacterium]|nr:MAG: hypothetical protein BMS9Abin05_2642 [Rhodothermia bacterium]